MDIHNTDPNPAAHGWPQHTAGFGDTRLKRLRRGTLLLIISLLLPTILINMTAFSFPFLGVGFGALRYLRIISILFAAPLLIAVFLLTTRRSCIEPRNAEAQRGNALRYSSVVYVGLFILNSAFRITAVADDPCFLYLERICGGASNVLGALYIAQLSLDLNDAQGTRTAKRWALAYAITRAVFLLLGAASYVADFHIEDHVGRAVKLSWHVLHGWLWIWGFTILFRLRKRLAQCLKVNCCTACGYLLTGLTEPRCPECGLHFATSTADV